MTSSTPKILFLTLYDESGASTRYSVYEYLPFIEAAGIKYEIRPLLKKEFSKLANSVAQPKGIVDLFKTLIFLILKFLSRYKDVWRSSEYPLTVVQKDVLPFGVQWILKLRAQRIIFMVDDPIWLKHPGAFGKIFLLGSFVACYRKHLFKEICKASDLVIVDNPYMKKTADQWAKKVIVIPTTINVQNYGKITVQQDPVAFGWIGSPSSVHLLQALLPLLEKLAETHPIRLINVSSTTLTSSKIEITNLVWTPENEIRAMENFCIGLMPMDQTEFSSFRTSRKWHIYSLANIVTLAQWTQLNAMLLKDEQDVVFYRTSDEFIENAKELILDEKKRIRIASEANRVVQNEYSLQAGGKMYLDAFRSVLDHPPVQ